MKTPHWPPRSVPSHIYERYRIQPIRRSPQRLRRKAVPPQLAWSHYRVLTKVADADAWAFYERETVVGGYGLYDTVVARETETEA